MGGGVGMCMVLLLGSRLLFTENHSQCSGVNVRELGICRQNPERLKEKTRSLKGSGQRQCW